MFIFLNKTFLFSDSFKKKASQSPTATEIKRQKVDITRFKTKLIHEAALRIAQATNLYLKSLFFASNRVHWLWFQTHPKITADYCT